MSAGKFYDITHILWHNAQRNLNGNVRKRINWHVRTAWFRLVWSKSPLSTWRNVAFVAIQKSPSEDSDQTARMRRLICIFVGRTCPKAHFRRSGTIYAWGSWLFHTVIVNQTFTGIILESYFCLRIANVNTTDWTDCKNNLYWRQSTNKPKRPKAWHVRPAKIQISLHIRAVWSESSLSAFWTAKDAKFLHANNEDCDQTARV